MEQSLARAETDTSTNITANLIAAPNEATSAVRMTRAVLRTIFACVDSTDLSVTVAKPPFDQQSVLGVIAPPLRQQPLEAQLSDGVMSPTLLGVARKINGPPLTGVGAS